MATTHVRCTPRSLGAVAVTLALLATACTGSSGGTTTTAERPATTEPAATSQPAEAPNSSLSTAPATTEPAGDPVAAPALPTFADDGEPIPVDADVRIRTLDNGLTYYIRRNTRPGERAQLRLAVKAGSVLEDEDQHGVAHYLEHMMFNGTERFPANELVKVLERFGAEFGPDINAYTNFEETVYELEFATDDGEIVQTAFDVLAEWAGAATIEPAEVELERGVLLEEWRVRSQRFEGRYFDGVIDRLLGGTVYDGQGPLADEAQLDVTTAATLRRFYEDWYRPDLMAVVAVGDFDVDEVEAMIVERFAGLAPRSGERQPVTGTTEAASEPAGFVLLDPEFAQAFVELNYPLPGLTLDTVGAVRQDLALDVAFDILVTRLDEDALRGDTAFFEPSFAANPLVRAQRSPGLAAFARPEDLADTAAALLTEVRRGAELGFTEVEVERAIAEFVARTEQAYDERAAIQDATYADRYVEHFLGAGAIPDAADSRDLTLRLLEEVTPAQVGDTFAAAISATEPFVIVVAPEAEAATAPTEADILDVVATVSTAPLQARDESASSIETLMTPPEPASIADRDNDLAPLGVRMLTLSNGAEVVMLPTSIREDTIVFAAVSPGGSSLVPDDAVTEARLVADVVARSGIGDLDQVDLDRFLAGRIVQIAPFIDDTTEGLFGQVDTEELETLLQLIHLYVTAPRFDERSLDNLLEEVRPLAENPAQSPDDALVAALLDARYSGDPRYRLLPPVAELDGFDLELAEQVYRDRFADAGDFAFVFVGDLDVAVTEDLARRYLGTLPSDGTTETWRDVRPDPPAGVERRTVAAGSGELGGLAVLYSELRDLDGDVRITAQVLDQILRQRLTERLREELGATYSPLVQVQLVEDPDPSIEVLFQVSTDPEGLEAVAAALFADLADLRAEGPTADELAIAQEQLVRNYELFSNEQLLQDLAFFLLHPGVDPGDLLVRIDRARSVTAGDVEELAAALLADDRYIEVRLVPAG